MNILKVGAYWQKQFFAFEVRLASGPLAASFVAKHPEPPTRIINIRGSQTLDDLHLAIFKAFDRFDHHMYEFQIGGKSPMDRKSVHYGIDMDDEFAAEANGKDATVTTIAALRIRSRLLAAIRASWLPWQRGKAQSWAAGIVHAAGMINFLHDSASAPHMKLRDIARHFGISPATMENKSRESGMPSISFLWLLGFVCLNAWLTVPLFGFAIKWNPR